METKQNGMNSYLKKLAAKKFIRAYWLMLGLTVLIPAQSAQIEPILPVLPAIPSGTFIAGSDKQERDYAYELDAAAYGNTLTHEQGWYENERERATAETKAYRIMATPVTNQQYAVFVAATKHRVPNVDRTTWNSYGLIHPFEETRRFVWRNGKPPQGRENHPVVLVNVADAEAYASWLTQVTGHTWRLPNELEWEKASRGVDGQWFPWGNKFDAQRLNTADKGFFDTVPVGQYLSGVSPLGMLDAAGQVYEWTATQSGEKRVVKGGSWDDKGCGVCRPAARHTRPMQLKHILIGFRLVREP